MKAKVCVCCGERMTPRTEALSGNSAICASCYSLLDMDDDALTEISAQPGDVSPIQTPEPAPAREPAESHAQEANKDLTGVHRGDRGD